MWSRPANAAELHRLTRLARDRAFAQLMRRSFAGMGRGCLLPPSSSIRGPENIVLASQVRFGAGCALSAFGHGTEAPAIRIGDGVEVGAGSRIHAIGDARIVVGEGTSLVGANSILAGVDVHIGARVLMAWNSGVTDSHHGFGDPVVAIKDLPLGRQAPVRIGDGAWLGTNAIVLPGVTIGRNAVVGANAVVTSDVPDHTVVAGAPARPLA